MGKRSLVLAGVTGLLLLSACAPPPDQGPGPRILDPHHIPMGPGPAERPSVPMGPGPVVSGSAMPVME